MGFLIVYPGETRWSGMHWSYLLQDRSQCRALVNTVMKFFVSLSVGKFFSRLSTGGFSRRSQPHILS
jgi:hypothetical protein